jgi:hypothetical protein
MLRGIAMNASKLLQDLTESGVTFSVDNNRFKLDGDKEIIQNVALVGIQIERALEIPLKFKTICLR